MRSFFKTHRTDGCVVRELSPLRRRTRTKARQGEYGSKDEILYSVHHLLLMFFRVVAVYEKRQL